MPTTATQVFDFLEQHQTCSIERHEIIVAAFDVLCSALRFIVVSLRESDEHEAREISDTLRMQLFELLTVPVPFIDDIFEPVRCFGEPEATTLAARWGNDIGINYGRVFQATHDLSQTENPIRAKLRTTIWELTNQKRAFKIYCHKRARKHFESLFDHPSVVPLGDAAFLHSVCDYRGAEPFDYLIKIGPLRSAGWGSAPDAILTAPRFGTLVQILWSGCADEQNFGYDPVIALMDSGTRNNRTSWSLQVTRSGSDTGGVGGNTFKADKGLIFQDMRQPIGNRPATLVQIDDECGILYPPHSQVLSYDLAAGVSKPLQQRLPGETLVEGMFVVRPLLQGEDIGGQQAEHAHYSRIWKQRLNKEFQENPSLTTRLRAEGLHLQHLHYAIGQWCKAPTTVIHAPQQKKHFEILVRVLGIGIHENQALQNQQEPWWQCAWNEIRYSRGEAIQAGVFEHEAIQEQMCKILESLLPSIQHLAAGADGFSICIPRGQSLQGAALFNKVLSIEEGFLPPDTELKVVRELNTIEQWRV